MKAACVCLGGAEESVGNRLLFSRTMDVTSSQTPSPLICTEAAASEPPPASRLLLSLFHPRCSQSDFPKGRPTRSCHFPDFKASNYFPLPHTLSLASQAELASASISNRFPHCSPP